MSSLPADINPADIDAVFGGGSATGLAVVRDEEWDWRTSLEPPPPGTPIEYAAAHYARMGLVVVPLVGKNPSAFGDDWWVRAITDPIEALQVFSDSRWTNIGWAQGYGTVAVDLDHLENATDEMLAVVDRGAANHTRPGRRHRVFTTTEEWGASTRGFPCQNWGEVRAYGGQVVIWGPHPDDPELHYSFDTRQQIPPAPAELVAWLTPREAYEVAATSAELAAFVAEHTETLNTRMIGPQVDRATEQVTAGRSIHVTATSTAAAMFRDVRAGLYSGEQARAALAAWWDAQWRQRAASPGSGRQRPGERELAGIEQWALAQAMTEPAAKIAETRERFTPADLDGLLSTSGAPAGPPAAAPNLPASFYESRPELAHIRQAAHCRGRAADAVLGVALARVAVLTPPTLRLPAPIDSEGTLDIAVTVIGRSGSGKSGAAKCARSLLPIEADDLAEVGLGSGEGVIEAYLGMVEEVDLEGKSQRVKRQVRRGVLFMLDEGQALAEMGGRRGSTLLPTIRSGWGGEMLGQANASEDRRRQLAASEYRFALVAGFQLEHATALLDDAAGGTPQRFLFLPAHDPRIPDDAPPWPGRLAWRPPLHQTGPMGLDSTVAAEIRRRGLAMARGEVDDRDPLDSRRDLVRLKVAGLLAVLAGRTDIDAEDWALAGQVVDTSDLVRSSIIDAARSRAREAERVRTAQLARRAASLDDDAASRALEDMAKAIARHVHRGKCDGGCRRRCVTQATASKHRKMATIDDALDEAARRSWVVLQGEQIVPGEAAP